MKTILMRKGWEMLRKGFPELSIEQSVKRIEECGIEVPAKFKGVSNG